MDILRTGLRTVNETTGKQAESMDVPSVAEPLVAVVIPAFDESATIAELITQIRHHVPGALVVVVDDSAGLDTVDAVSALALSGVRAIHREGKGGRGSAVVEGTRALLQSGCDFVVEMDADLAHPPAQIPELVAFARRTGCDLVIASRYLPASRIENYSLARRALSRASNLLERLLLRVPVSDYTMGYRLYSRAAATIVAEHCAQLGSGFIVLGEILVQVHGRGLKVGEIPTHFVHRVRAQGSVGFTEIWRSLESLVRIARLRRRLASEDRGRAS